MSSPNISLDLFGDPVVEEVPLDTTGEDFKINKHELFDFVRSVKETKVDLRKESITVTRGKGDKKRTITIPPDPDLKTLDMFMLLKMLSNNDKLAPIAQMMNTMPHLPKDMQYVFLLTAIPAIKSYDKSVKKTVDKTIKQLVESCGMTQRDAEEAAYVFTPEQLNSFIADRKEKDKCKQKKS